MEIPKLIFIVPYRERPEQLSFFKQYMSYILEDEPANSYRIVISHQKDKRVFNRGAVKNIGFIAMKKEYPEHYKDITFVFNDVDTIPHKKGIIDYHTKKGEIKHFYGFRFALGGMFSIKGEDFENINGFPNYWGWGYEDNKIQDRAMQHKLAINRDVFFPFGSMSILQLQNDIQSILKRLSDPNRLTIFKTNNGGISDIKNLVFEVENNFINIHKFDSDLPYSNNYKYLSSNYKSQYQKRAEKIQNQFKLF